MFERMYSSVGGKKEKVTFGLYFVLVLISAWFVADVLTRGWRRGHIVRVVLDHAPTIILGLSLMIVGATLFGVYVGLLILLNIDPKKQWQGRILAIGTVIAVVVMQTQGVFNIAFIENAPWVLVGIFIGIAAGGGEKLVQGQVAEAIEFRRAATILFYLLAALTIGALLEAHVTYPWLFNVQPSAGRITLNLPYPPANPIEPREFGLRMSSIYVDTGMTGLFLFTLNKFIQYDAEKSFFIIGPSESGKTLFLIGSYLEALESYNGSDNGLWTTPMNPTQDLMEMIDQLDQSREEWVIGGTGAGEVRELGFRYVHGDVFPLNIHLTALDYAGEHLGSIPDAISGVLQIEDYPNPAILRALVQNIQEADTLILVIDIERFIDQEESLEISPYFDLLQAVEGKQVMLVATKSDLLAEEFTKETGLQPVRFYDDFAEYVNERLAESQQIQSLIAETAGTEIHPVYYQTRETDDGERVPMRDETNSIMVVGFDQFLDKIGR